MAAIGASVLAAAALKVWLALTTYGTSDVWYWEQYLAAVREIGVIQLYHVEPNFNHPPFTAHMLLAMGAAADASGIPFPFWLRLPAILADALTVVLVALLGARREAEGARTLAGRAGALSLVLLALAPASAMVSGYHGNTDPLVMCLVLLGVVAWELRRGTVVGAALAGLAVGMALNVKVVPIIFLPAFVLSIGGWRFLVFLAAAGAAIVVGSMPYLVQDPAIIAQKVLGYGSYYGHWGLSRLLADFAPSGGLAARLDEAFRTYGRYLAVGLPALSALLANAPHVLAGLARRVGLGGRGWLGGLGRPPLYVQCGIAAALFLAVSPGFGTQYVAWLVPWAPAAGAAAGVAFHATTGIFLFCVYDYWSGHFPWHTADARPYEFEWWPRPVVNLELMAWASVLVVAGVLVRVGLRGTVSRQEQVATSN